MRAASHAKVLAADQKCEIQLADLREYDRHSFMVSARLLMNLITKRSLRAAQYAASEKAFLYPRRRLRRLRSVERGDSRISDGSWGVSPFAYFDYYSSHLEEEGALVGRKCAVSLDVDDSAKHLVLDSLR